MRLDRRARQIVFGDHHLGRAPGRTGRVLSGYSHGRRLLKLMVARNSADFRNVSGFAAHSGSMRFCGLIGWLTWA